MIRADNEDWDDLGKALHQASTSLEAGLRETAFRVFTTTPGIIEKEEHENVVLGVFSNGFKDENIAVCFDTRDPNSTLLVIASFKTSLVCSSIGLLGTNCRHGSLRRVVSHYSKGIPFKVFPTHG